MPAHILIAEDEPALNAILQLFFKQLGYKVTGVYDGEEALQIILDELPDLCLLDIQMPRKSGIELVAELRANPRCAQIPLIAITAHVRDYMPPAVRKAGFDRLISKPFDFDDLASTVEDLLGKG